MSAQNSDPGNYFSYTNSNRYTLLMNPDGARCVYCYSTIFYNQIVEWIPAAPNNTRYDSAFCPYCCIDTVVPKINLPDSEEDAQTLLEQWRLFGFGSKHPDI